jgi:hypothetical protein
VRALNVGFACMVPPEQEEKEVCANEGSSMQISVPCIYLVGSF